MFLWDRIRYPIALVINMQEIYTLIELRKKAADFAEFRKAYLDYFKTIENKQFAINCLKAIDRRELRIKEKEMELLELVSCETL